MSLRDAFVNPDRKQAYVRRLFATIADRYDLITRLLSFGLDQRWKAVLAQRAGAGPSDHALDLACGTGDIALALARGGAPTVGLDITRRMLALARDKVHASSGGASLAPIRFVCGDMCALPFPDASFSLVTTGYGLRNVPDLDRALTEIARVLAPGGRLLSLDFNRPASPIVRGAYLTYLTAVGSALGWILHRDPDTYRYIPESIRRFPGAAGVADGMRHAGFVSVEVVPLLAGLMSLHVARRPGLYPVPT